MGYRIPAYVTTLRSYVTYWGWHGGIRAYGDTGIGAKLSLCLPYVGAMGYAMPSVCRQMAVPCPVWGIGWGYPYITGIDGYDRRHPDACRRVGDGRLLLGWRGDGHLAWEASKGLSKCTPFSPEPWGVRAPPGWMLGAQVTEIVLPIR